jgi:hypothetical protein
LNATWLSVRATVIALLAVRLLEEPAQALGQILHRDAFLEGLIDNPLHVAARGVADADDALCQIIHEAADVRISQIPGDVDAELLGGLDDGKFAIITVGLARSS